MTRSRASVELSVKATVSGAGPLVTLAVKFATGAGVNLSISMTTPSTHFADQLVVASNFIPPGHVGVVGAEDMQAPGVRGVVGKEDEAHGGEVTGIRVADAPGRHRRLRCTSRGRPGPAAGWGVVDPFLLEPCFIAIPAVQADIVPFGSASDRGRQMSLMSVPVDSAGTFLYR